MKILVTSILSFFVIQVFAQQARQYDLVQLLKDHQLENYSEKNPEITKGSDKKSISASGITWIKGTDFKDGIIEVDLRGKNIFQQSFVGIAFHGTDTAHYETVYFRPFNFKSTDTLRQKHAVQYTSLPDYPWHRLRKEQPLRYESAVTPLPDPDDWFHAKVIISKDSIYVYVNHSNMACLKVHKLINQSGKMIGLFNDGLPGDFANLITKPLKGSHLK